MNTKNNNVITRKKCLKKQRIKNQVSDVIAESVEVKQDYQKIQYRERKIKRGVRKEWSEERVKFGKNIGWEEWTENRMRKGCSEERME